MTTKTFVIATGKTGRPELITPQLADQERSALGELVSAGLVQSAYLHDGRVGVTLVLSVTTIPDASRALQALPYVAAGIHEFSFVVATSLLP